VHIPVPCSCAHQEAGSQLETLCISAGHGGRQCKHGHNGGREQSPYSPFRKGAEERLVVCGLRRESANEALVDADRAPHDVQILADGGQRPGALHLHRHVLPRAAQPCPENLSPQ